VKANERKRALVTGANRGLGFETARELFQRGFDVTITARDERKGRSALDKISREHAAGGASLAFHRLDVADEESVAALGAALKSQGIRVDVLVNNAAVAMDGFDENVARATVRTNFFGPMWLTDALLPLIPDGGTIVMVSSGAGELSILAPRLRPAFTDAGLTRAKLVGLMSSFVEEVRNGSHERSGWPSNAYGVSKAGLNALVRVMSPELKQRRIRINAVCPGWVRTDMGGPSASRSLEEGAASILWAALLESEQTGGFFRDGKPIRW
jgi:carbonyl reductase 1